MSDFQDTMGRLADNIRRAQELEDYRKESSKKAFEQGRKQGAVEELDKILWYSKQQGRHVEGYGFEVVKLEDLINYQKKRLKDLGE